MKTVGQIYLTSKLIDKLEIPISSLIKVRVGVKTYLSQLIVRNSQRRSYILSSQLTRALNLKNTHKLQIRYDQENEMIHIGPIIGIMADHLPNEPEYEPNSVQAELIYLSHTGLRLPAQYYLFTPGSINWTKKTVRGYTYRKLNQDQGNWVSSEYPIPDIVYDRIASRRGEARARVRYTKKKLMSMPFLKYFNPSFLNKWKVHELLINNESLIPYLPETQLLNLTNLKEMISKYTTLFLKPCNGSLGHGIIKVICDQNGKLRYTVYKKGRHSGHAGSPAGLMKATRHSRKKHSYIVQQGINLDSYHHSAFDIRIIYQKNSDGDWLISKKFVRVAPHGSSVANMSRGGTAETSKKVFDNIFKMDSELISTKNEELKNMCQMVAETLEDVSHKLYGELGLDIGIDKEGNFWLIEVNSKPRKTTETELSQGIVRNTFRRPLQYAIHLAGFKTHR
jgi:glutathione synthase/RimK-type ligase-like ATP-grasp enzyme